MKAELARAGQVGAAAQLTDIRQLSVTAELHQPAPTVLHADVDINSDWTSAGPVLLCRSTAALTVTEGEGGDPVFAATVTFGAVYQLPDDHSFVGADFDAFATTSGSFSLHPYLREALQDQTARAGLPAFILPILRSPLPADEAAAALGFDAEQEQVPQKQATKRTSEASGKKPATRRTSKKADPG